MPTKDKFYSDNPFGNCYLYQYWQIRFIKIKSTY